MSLSSELISQFVKITNDVDKTVSDKTLYGTAVEYDDTIWVKIDGSDQLTPIKSTTTIKPGDRVMVEIANHNAIVTGNLSSPSARQEDVDDEIDRIGNVITDFEIVIAGKVDTIEFNAEVARIEELRTDNVVIKKNLTAAEANIKVLEADYVAINEKLIADEAEIDNLKTSKLDASIADITYATIDNLEATNADINNLEATYATFENATVKRLDAVEAFVDDLDVNYATIEQLEAEHAIIEQLEATMMTADSAVIKSLQADVADIDTLIFGSASGDTIQTSFANAVIAQLGDAQIKSAMIENVSANKITAGDIITNNVRVMSQDGSLVISDETIQISDDTRVRVQIGKDATNDYSINIWDADGNLMFSEGGITDKAIKDAIIRNDMVASDANIAASKLDINSLFEEINDSEKTINSGRIYMDADKQTLDVVFKSMTSDIDDIKSDVSTQGTSLSVIQGQISSKIWQQDINSMKSELDEDIDSLSTQYSEITQDINSISTTVSSHATQISNKADSSAVTAVNDRVTKVETDLSGISATVSSHSTQISNKADSSTVTEISNRVTSLDTDLDGFKTTVSNTYATKTALSATDTKATTAKSTADEAKSNAATAQAKANEAATAVDNLAVRVSTAETSITQNSEQIALRATKTEVATMLDDYSTTEDMQAAIELSTNQVKTTVSNTYATKTALSTTDTKATNAATAAANAQEDVDTLAETVETTYATKAEVIQTANSITSSVSATYATKTDLNNKANDYTILLYNGTGGNPKPVKFVTVNYSTCDSENGVSIKIGMLSGHGNGTSYTFLQDAMINVNHVGGVTVDNIKSYGAETPEYDGVVRQYGDIFWVIDTTNKIVDFYVLMGQYARVYQTPWKRTTYSTGGTVTQYTSCTVYSSGEKNWANNSDMALMSDVDALSEEVGAKMVEQQTTIMQDSERILLSALETYETTKDAEAFKETVNAQLAILANEITMSFTTTSGHISDVDDDLQSKFTELYNFIKFSGGGITISESTGLSLELAGGMIAFKKNGQTFGTWNGVDFFTGNIVVQVNERAQFGNFAFIPRSDGSLMLLKVGG